MRVILLKDVGGVGRRDEVRDVADGYALNLLIPRALAEQATPDKIVALEKRRKSEEAARTDEIVALAEAIRGLEGARIEIPARSTQKGGLFKAVGAEDIADAIARERGVHIPPASIILEKVIKEVGEYTIALAPPGAGRAGGEAHATMTVAIVAKS